MVSAPMRLFPLLLVLLFLGCREQILHGLDERRANKAQLLLLQASIGAEKLRQGKEWSIAVDSDDVERALALLEHFRLPRRESGHSVGNSGGLLVSSEEKEREHENENCIRAEQSLEQLPGVLEARVHVSANRSAQAIFPSSPVLRSASVLLVLETGTNLDETHVRSFLSGTLGVSAERISVMVSEAKDPVSHLRSPSTSRGEGSAPLSKHFSKNLVLGLTLSAGLGGLVLVCLFRRRQREVRTHRELRVLKNEVLSRSSVETIRDPFVTSSNDFESQTGEDEG